MDGNQAVRGTIVRLPDSQQRVERPPYPLRAETALPTTTLIRGWGRINAITMNKEILSRRWPGSILELAQKRLTQAPTAYSESPSLYHYRTDLSLFTLGSVTKHEHGRQHGSELLYSRCSVGRDIGPGMP